MQLIGRLLFGADAAVKELVSGTIRDHVSFRDDDVAIGVVRGGQLVGGCVYHDYSVHDIRVSWASIDRQWLSRDVLHALFAYPFVQLGCVRITAAVSRRNKRSRKICEGLGFKFEGVMRKGFGDRDAMIYGMLREECKFLKVPHG